MPPINSRSNRRAWFAIWLVCLFVGSGLLPKPTAVAQDPDASSTGPQGAEAVSTGEATPSAPDSTLDTGAVPQLDLLQLLISGGFFMIPLVALSVVVATITIERALVVRRTHVLPPIFVRELAELGRASGGFDPRAAYRLCQEYPSAAGRVIQAMLTKVGRPQSEVEHTVAEASQREAERLHSNIRWLTLCAQVAPLVGLLGTVWGMILAFYATTQLGPGQNKSEALAEGIYTALVTTLYGLCVAIPAAIAAHWFEGRIIRLFHQIDELAFNLFPQVERFEGKIRFSRQED